MLLPPGEWLLKTSTQRILASVHSPPMQMRYKISAVTGPKFTKFVAVVIFSWTVLTQQSALRCVHSLSNERGRHKKKVTSVKRDPAGGVAMPGGLKMLLLWSVPPRVRAFYVVNLVMDPLGPPWSCRPYAPDQFAYTFISHELNETSSFCFRWLRWDEDGFFYYRT